MTFLKLKMSFNHYALSIFFLQRMNGWMMDGRKEGWIKKKNNANGNQKQKIRTRDPPPPQIHIFVWR
jgi:hypothetical protein